MLPKKTHIGWCRYIVDANSCSGAKHSHYGVNKKQNYSASLGENTYKMDYRCVAWVAAIDCLCSTQTAMLPGCSPAACVALLYLQYVFCCILQHVDDNPGAVTHE